MSTPEERRERKSIRVVNKYLEETETPNHRSNEMRLKKLLLSGQFLIDWCISGKHTNLLCTHGLPEGTKFCYTVPHTNFGIYLIIEHESFPMLIPGDIIPDADYPQFIHLDKYEINQGAEK